MVRAGDHDGLAPSKVASVTGKSWAKLCSHPAIFPVLSTYISHFKYYIYSIKNHGHLTLIPLDPKSLWLHWLILKLCTL